MSKSFLFKILTTLFIFLTAVLWLLSEAIPETFGFFNMTWAIALLSAGLGVLFVLRGVFGKSLVTIKWFKIILGALLLILAFFNIFSETGLSYNYLIPIIAVIAAGAIALGVIGTGGKSWDTADNKKVGYKNYHQRKAEADKQAKKADKE